jgi:RNA recognition motif-containing protein
MNIFIANMSERLKEDHVCELFEAFGVVTKVKILKDFNFGISKGIGFVEMRYEADGKAAIACLNKCELDGKTKRVTIAKNREGKNKTLKKRY